jgi:hypothetical protein
VQEGREEWRERCREVWAEGEWIEGWRMEYGERGGTVKMRRSGRRTFGRRVGDKQRGGERFEERGGKRGTEREGRRIDGKMGRSEGDGESGKERERGMERERGREGRRDGEREAEREGLRDRRKKWYGERGMKKAGRRERW